MSTKKCSSCDEVKPLEDFHKDNNRPDGRRSACRVCRSKKHQQADIAVLPPLPPPAATIDERQRDARAAAIRDVIENHWPEFRSRYSYHLDKLNVQARWFQLS